MLCEEIEGHEDFRPLSDIAGIRVDLRYATPHNFVGRNLYGRLNCSWLHREAASGLQAAVYWLQAHCPGTTLCVLDALRPHRVQVQLWEHLKGTELRQYLADPARGSIHSFGMAVDVTLLDAAGIELDMGTGFDDLTLLSHPKHEPAHLAQGLLNEAHLRHRQHLRDAMLHGGFSGISTEWWHFDCGDRAAVRASYVRVD